MGWISSKRKKVPHVCVVPIAVSGCKHFALHDEMPSEDKNMNDILNQNAASPQAFYRNFFDFSSIRLKIFWFIFTAA
ncbi:hypothetical protein [Neisseria sp. LACPHL-SPEC-2024-00856]|uniref:hypothetical protein n=1 Tax=Neisseria sp. LACPHL-SPEC-2024-00856 TaxID=3391057 RepID=UPI003A4E4837